MALAQLSRGKPRERRCRSAGGGASTKARECILQVSRGKFAGLPRLTHTPTTAVLLQVHLPAFHLGG